MDKWIQIKEGERRPRNGRDVLISIDGMVMPACRIGGVWCDFAGFPMRKDPDAWRPFPEPYSEE